MLLQKIPVEQKHYEMIKEYEVIHSSKIKDLNYVIPIEVDGEWGVYKVYFCYASFYNNYFAKVCLIQPAENKLSALLKTLQITNQQLK